MKVRLYLVLGILLVAAVGGLLWWAPWEARQVPEPVYDGKPLSYWLTNQMSVQMQKEIIGDSNAVPFLIKAVKQDKWFGAAYYRKWLWPKLPPVIQRHLAKDAGNPVARHNATIYLGNRHEKQAIPALVRAVKEDGVASVRATAAWSLGTLATKEDKTAVAALTEALKDKYAFVCQAATNALLKIDPEAAAKAGVDTNPSAAVIKRLMQLRATNAVPRIDPEAAAKAGVKRPSP
jgi:hypothetical protein